MGFTYGLDYEKLPHYIEVAKEVIRGLGKAAAQEAAIEEPAAQEAAEEIPPVDIVQFYTAMNKHGITPPGALLAADTADSIEVDHLENTVRLSEPSSKEEPTEE